MAHYKQPTSFSSEFPKHQILPTTSYYLLRTAQIRSSRKKTSYASLLAHYQREQRSAPQEESSTR